MYSPSALLCIFIVFQKLLSPNTILFIDIRETCALNVSRTRWNTISKFTTCTVRQIMILSAYSAGVAQWRHVSFTRQGTSEDNEISNKIQVFRFKKIHLKILSPNFSPFLQASASQVVVIGYMVFMYYSDTIMSAMASKITGVSIAYSTVCSCTDQAKHQSSAPVAFVRGIHRWPVNSPHKWSVTRKMFPFEYVIMCLFVLRLQVFTISLSWGNAFYHALIEDFSRLIPFLSFLKRNKQVKVHVYRPNSFMTSLLEMVGIPRERLISGVAEARVLYQPAGSRCGFGTFFPLQALSMISTKDFALAALPRDTVVLIKRSKLRWFDYHDDILQMLKNITTKYLTNVVVYDDKALPSLQDTIALFYRTFMIVAPHGAGLSNMVYSRPGTFILEGLCCGETVNLCYQTLADLLGHRHYGVFKPGGCFDVLPEDIQPVAEFALEAFCHPDEQVPF